jgi:hypothetical protein
MTLSSSSSLFYSCFFLLFFAVFGLNLPGFDILLLFYISSMIILKDLG